MRGCSLMQLDEPWVLSLKGSGSELKFTTLLPHNALVQHTAKRLLWKEIGILS